jgi:hypothetical protein
MAHDMRFDLPPEITKHLPDGFQPRQGVWFVLPELDAKHDGIATVNSWIRAEDWYPQSLQDVIWYGDDGVGNLFGWRPKKAQAILWNPEDGDRPFKIGTIQELWDFVSRGYDAYGAFSHPRFPQSKGNSPPTV